MNLEYIKERLPIEICQEIGKFKLGQMKRDAFAYYKTSGFTDVVSENKTRAIARSCGQYFLHSEGQNILFTIQRNKYGGGRIFFTDTRTDKIIKKFIFKEL